MEHLVFCFNSLQVKTSVRHAGNQRTTSSRLLTCEKKVKLPPHHSHSDWTEQKKLILLCGAGKRPSQLVIQPSYFITSGRIVSIQANMDIIPVTESTVSFEVPTFSPGLPEKQPNMLGAFKHVKKTKQSHQEN